MCDWGRDDDDIGGDDDDEKAIEIFNFNENIFLHKFYFI